MHGANGVASRALQWVLRPCGPCLRESLVRIQGKCMTSTLGMAESVESLLRRTSCPKYRVPLLSEKCPRHENHSHTDSHADKPNVTFAGYLFACRIESHISSIASTATFNTDT